MVNRNRGPVVLLSALFLAYSACGTAATRSKPDSEIMGDPLFDGGDVASEAVQNDRDSATFEGKLDSSVKEPFMVSILVSPQRALCSGECVQLTAVASLGNPPYSYHWDHEYLNGPGPLTVCPRTTTAYTVTASDSWMLVEFQNKHADVSASATVYVTDCFDANQLIPVKDASFEADQGVLDADAIADADEPTPDAGKSREVCSQRWQVVGLEDSVNGWMGGAYAWDGDHLVATDPDGNAIIAGMLSGTLDFGSGSIVNDAGTDAFIVKIDPQCELVWAKSYASVDASTVVGGVAVDKEGNIFVSGELEGDFDFGNGILSSGLMSAPLLMKLDPNGEALWSKIFPDRSEQYGGWGAAIATDAAGNVVFSGECQSLVDFGSGPLIGPLSEPFGHFDFIAKFNSDGDNLWSHVIKGVESGRRLAMQPDGAVITAGFARREMVFGNTIRMRAADNDFRYLAKLDTEGTFLWNIVTDVFTYENIYTSLFVWIELDSFNNIFIQRYTIVPDSEGQLTDSPGFSQTIAKYDPTGNPIWMTHGLVGNSSAKSAAIDSNGRFVVFNSFTETISVGADTLTSRGETDLFLYEVDSQGRDLGNLQIGGERNDLPFGIAFDPKGNLFVVSIQDTDWKGREGALVVTKLTP